MSLGVLPQNYDTPAVPERCHRDITGVCHAVHDGHELLQSRHRLLLITLCHEVTAETRDHALSTTTPCDVTWTHLKCHTITIYLYHMSTTPYH